MLIVHLGTNDLMETDFFCCRQRLAIFMQHCLDTYPYAHLVRSDILPRACYFGATNPAKIEKKRRSINRWARSIGCRMG